MVKKKRNKYKKKHYKRREYALNETQKKVLIVGTFLFLVYFTHNYINNCIITWPIRWDIKECWVEQIEPAKEKAVEDTINLTI